MYDNEKETPEIHEHNDTSQYSEPDEKKYEGTPNKKKRSKSPFVFAGIVLASFVAFMYMQPKQDIAPMSASEVSEQVPERASSEQEEHLALPPLGQGEASSAASGVSAASETVVASGTQPQIPNENKQPSTETKGRVAAASTVVEQDAATAKASDARMSTAVSEPAPSKTTASADTSSTGRTVSPKLNGGSVLMSCVETVDGLNLVCTPQERIENNPTRKPRYHNQHRRSAGKHATVPRKPASSTRRSGQTGQRVVDEDSRRYQRLF